MNRRNPKKKAESSAALAASQVEHRPQTGSQPGGEQSQIRKELGQFERVSIRIQLWMLLVTLVLAVVTAAYVAVTYRQLQVMREQSDASNKAMHLDERAWIGVSKARIGELKLGEPVHASVAITNSGKTPAKNLKLWTHLDFAISDEPFPPLNQGGVFKGSNVLLYPNVTVSIAGTFYDDNGNPKPVDQALTQGITAGLGFVVVHGGLTYEDVFNQPHWATFCFMTRKDTPWGPLVECEHGNESDN